MTQVMKSRVDKMAETYCLGVVGLKELADMLQRKASSDLNQINDAISSQATVVENVWFKPKNTTVCIIIISSTVILIIKFACKTVFG